MKKEDLIHALRAGALAGIGAGVITGFCARGIMCVLALCTHVDPQCTMNGTMQIIGAYMLGGAVLGPLFLGLRQSGPVPVAARMLIICLLLVAVVYTPIWLIERFNQGVMTQGLSLMCTILFAVLLPIYGLSIALMSSWLERRLQHEQITL